MFFATESDVHEGSFAALALPPAVRAALDGETTLSVERVNLFDEGLVREATWLRCFTSGRSLTGAGCYAEATSRVTLRLQPFPSCPDVRSFRQGRCAPAAERSLRGKAGNKAGLQR
jgi:hypothetical protein